MIIVVMFVNYVFTRLERLKSTRSARYCRKGSRQMPRGMTSKS
jgi:hypothetical protein